MSKQRQKGTREETAIVNEWNDYFGVSHHARRMPAGSRYDVHVDGFSDPEIAPPVDVLVTRADKGERLATLRFKDLMTLWSEANTGGYELAPELHMESKRYARFALHTIFFTKFGKAKR